MSTYYLKPDGQPSFPLPGVPTADPDESFSGKPRARAKPISTISVRQARRQALEDHHGGRGARRGGGVKMKAFNVYRNGKCIDTVFWNERADGGALTTKEDVRRSLIGHDGYHTDIRVYAARPASAHKKYPA